MINARLLARRDAATFVDFAILAYYRYSKNRDGRMGVEPGMAMEMFLNDRRTAGLGALDASRRWQASQFGPRRYKVVDWERPRLVRYTVTNHYEPRMEYPPFDPLDSFTMGPAADAYITLRRVPEVNVSFNLIVERRDFETQTGRKSVAMRLRDMRRQLRAATEAARAGS